MIKVRKYEDGDALKINIKENAFVPNDVVYMSMEAEMAKVQPHIKHYTITNDDKPIAVIGAVYTEKDEVLIDAIVGREVEECGIAFAKMMKRWLLIDTFEKNTKVVRTSLRATYPEGRKWLSFLGLQKLETIKGCYEDDVDCEIWGAVL